MVLTSACPLQALQHSRRGWKSKNRRKSDAGRRSPGKALESRCTRYKRWKAGVHVIIAEASRLKFQELARSAQRTALLVLQPLGWRIADGSNKCLPFSKLFRTVGSNFSMAKAPKETWRYPTRRVGCTQGNVVISNKESRLLAYKEGRMPALRTMVNSVCNNGFDNLPGWLCLLCGVPCTSTHTFGSGYLFGREEAS